MNKEDKDFLLKDLCARLLYSVKIEITYSKDSGSSLRARLCCEGINTLDTNILWLFQQSEVYIKPYLFPLSSMTEEQKKELDKKFNVIDIYGNNILIHYHSQGYWDTDLEVDFQDWLWLINWLNKNHFDYHGLIKKGLALDATGLNIY